MMQWPSRIENDYRRAMRRRFRAAESLCMAILDEDEVVRNDAGELDRIANAMRSAFIGFNAARYGRAIMSYAEKTTMKVMGEVATRAPIGQRQAILIEWVSTQAGLVNRAIERAVDRMHSAISVPDAVALRDVIRKTLGGLRDNLDIIASNESTNLVRRTDEVTQRANNVSRYEWVTMRDARVRDTHRALHGTIREWGDPHPTEGHPGDAINCRCRARPIL